MADEDEGKLKQMFETVKAKAEEVKIVVDQIKAAYEKVQAKRAERKEGDEG